MLRGALLGGGLAALVFGLWTLDEFYDMIVNRAAMGRLEPEDLQLLALFLLLPVGLATASGALLGFMAARLEHARFLRMFVASLGLYLACALGTSLALILGVGLSDGFNPDGNLIWDALALAFAGAVFLGAIAVPGLALIVFILERWTRRKIANQSEK